MKLWARTTLVTLTLLTTGLGHAHAFDATTLVGRGVEIQGDATEEGFLAHRVEKLRDPRTLKIRAPLDSFDAARETLSILGHDLYWDENTEVVGFDSLTDIADHGVGTQVEIKAAPRSHGLYAKRIVATPDKTTIKIKGTVSDLQVLDASVRSIDLGGFIVAVGPQLRITSEEDVVDRVLMQEMREDEDPTSSGSYGFAIGPARIGGSVRENIDERIGSLLDPDVEDVIDFTEPSLRLEALARPSPRWMVFAQLKAAARYELRKEPGSLVTDGDDAQLQLRQLYVAARDLGGRPLGLSVGKQRIRDRRELMFDEYLDALRVLTYAGGKWALEGALLAPVAPLRDKYDTWTDGLLRLHAGTSNDDALELLVLRRWDDDARNREPTYFALFGVTEPTRSTRLWGSGLVLRGEDKGLRSRGWAFDLGAAVRARRVSFEPFLQLTFTRASGDDPNTQDVDESFHQSGYEDNSSRLWGVSSIKSFGEALDPELQNLQILGMGAGFHPMRNTSVELIVHRYHQVVASRDLEDTELWVEENILTGDDEYLGWGGELVIATRRIAGRLDASYKLGWFAPKDAFVSAPDVLRSHSLQLRFNF